MTFQTMNQIIMGKEQKAELTGYILGLIKNSLKFEDALEDYLILSVTKDVSELGKEVLIVEDQFAKKYRITVEAI